VNSFQNKCWCYCHSQLTLTSLLLSLHKCNSYSRIANNYWPRFCRTNIEHFTILYQGPEIWISPPGSLTNSYSYLNFKENMFLLKGNWVRYDAQALPVVKINETGLWGGPLWYVEISWGLFATAILTSIVVILWIVWGLSIHSFIQKDRPGGILWHFQWENYGKIASEKLTIIVPATI